MIKKFLGLLALIIAISFSVTSAAIQLPNNTVTSKQISAVSYKCGLLSATKFDSLKLEEARHD